MVMKTIKQKVKFNASADTLYNLLMHEKEHAAFTGAAAKISTRINGKFSAWDDYISGKNIVLEKGKKIVQEWWCADLPEDHFTTVTFTFSKLDNKTTQLDFTQTNVPPDQYDALSKGWKEYYWDPMKQYLGEL